jgi:tetratricopeptide (TPR) repeat protein
MKDKVVKYQQSILTRRTCILFICMWLFCYHLVYSQETVLTLMKNDIKKADEYFEAKSYQRAVDAYHMVKKPGKQKNDITTKIARCYFYLHQFEQAVSTYNTLISSGLEPTDMFLYAESLAATGNYAQAIEWYTKYIDKSKNDAVQDKIWRLKNIKYLYEDSVHYSISPVSFNSVYADLCPVISGKHLIFMSNRKDYRPLNVIDEATNTPFYKLYYTSIKHDSVHSQLYEYNNPEPFCRELNAKFHEGPVALYDNATKMIYTATSSKKNSGDKRVLQLFFAEHSNGNWKIITSYPYNSVLYSISEPAISSDGKTLYFASDMPGGAGGKDLYKSVYINNSWSKPENLGPTVNTYNDEGFPFLYGDQVLYFSSNGHPGIGGSDLFKVALSMNNKLGEVQNLGYPLNTTHDELGIVLDDEGAHGYLSSNRNSKGINDDIFEFNVDLQSYPLTINGTLWYKEVGWQDSSKIKVLKNTTLFLMDNVRNIVVSRGVSDANGHFFINIPYFSQYTLRVVESDGNETVVSLDISKDRKSDRNHAIVVVKDIYKRSDE